MALIANCRRALALESASNYRYLGRRPFEKGEPRVSERCKASISRMGFRALEGSWLEGQDALVSTAVGALTFWLLGAVVGLLVSSSLNAGASDALSRDRKARNQARLQACCEGTTA